MIRQLFAVLLKEFNVIRHDLEALALLFAMPVFFILVMSLALEGVFDSGSSSRTIEILLINDDKGGLAKEIIVDLKKMERLSIIDSLNEMPVTLKAAESLILNDGYGFVLHFQPQFSAQILSESKLGVEDKPAVTLIFDPTINAQLVTSLEGTVQGVIGRQVILARLSHSITQDFSHLEEQGKPEIHFFLREFKLHVDRLLNKLKTDRIAQDTLPIEVVPLRATGVRRRPNSAEQNVPAYTIFGIFFIVLTLASSFLKEKQEGTFQRILAAPLSKTTLMIGKLIPYYFINLIQVALMFAVGVAFFDLHLGNISALVLVSLAVSASANGLGLLVAGIGRTEAQVNGLSVFLAIILSALGGMMVPVFVMPEFMKTLSQFTPHAWALKGYHDVIIRGLGVRDVLGEAGILFGFAFLLFLFGLWRFRFN